MVVVPVARRLEIEALVANKDIGFVAEGQAVEIKVETFPFTKYGIIDGEVLHLSRDAIADENLGPVYAARVSMARATMEVGGNTVNLAPGMAGNGRDQDRSEEGDRVPAVAAAALP